MNAYTPLERFKISQSAIIRNAEGRILILRSPVGKWLLPGGCINEGEHALPGLIREVKEDIGLDLEQVLSITNADTWYDEKGAWCTIGYECTVRVTEPITLSHEHDEFRWVTEPELDGIPFWHPAIAERIRKVLAKYA
jgi:8-oxo-dGTP pyrophosphatase MutT (NUDIX family)